MNKSLKELNNELIYELLFSKKIYFNINVGKHIDEIYKYDVFIDDIKKILIKSKVFLMSDDLKIDNKGIIMWKIKVKR